jgi:glycosyltransferase involved in cell wall biosynthesis
VRKLAVFGPLPPPMTGMEAFTVQLLAQLDELDRGRLCWRHADTSISTSIGEREHLRATKVGRLLVQLARSIRLAAAGYDAYAPLSQNRIGLIRDLVLLAPFRLVRRRVVVHLNGGAFDSVFAEQPRWLQWSLRWLVSRDDARGIVVAASLRSCLEPILPRERILVVHNPVDDPGEPVAKLESPPLRVLFIATVMASKGYRELVTAVASLADRGVPVRLELAGLPYTEEDADWLAAIRHPAVELLGYVDGVAKAAALARAHVVAQPSTAPEGQPFSILEGMAAGCGVVGTRWPGIADTVSDAAGVLVPAARGVPLERALEETLGALAASPERVARLGRGARERFDREFSTACFLELWLEAVA